MRILHLSTTDIIGGAARGAYWLHTALQQTDVDSKMLVLWKASDDTTVTGNSGKNGKLRNRLFYELDQIPVKLYPRRTGDDFTPAWYSSPRIQNEISNLKPEIVNLHWVSRGFISVKDISKITQPVVLTLRDMWAFTGGCHYSDGCLKYQTQCGNCPSLGSSKPKDQAYRTFVKKQSSWDNNKITIVAISQWLADCARSSALLNNLRIEVIHNALDHKLFSPKNKSNSRNKFKLPEDKMLIAFGAINAAHDMRKGYQYFREAMEILGDSDYSNKLAVVIFGASPDEIDTDLKLQTIVLGHINDDIRLAELYSACDIMVVPSTEEAFGKTAMEAMACGTPVVSFDSTGLKDIVDHRKNGYRARCFDSSDLANGILWCISDEIRHKDLSANAREKVETSFTFDIQAEKYRQLYKEILDIS